MGFFGLFKKKSKLTVSQIKWNKMWDLWTEEKIASPYLELMTYQSEINNGGHSQYFTNIENTKNLQNELSELGKILSPYLNDNLQKAYEAYKISEENDADETAEEILKRCDDIFLKMRILLSAYWKIMPKKHSLPIELC